MSPMRTMPSVPAWVTFTRRKRASAGDMLASVTGEVLAVWVPTVVHVSPSRLVSMVKLRLLSCGARPADSA